MYPSNCIALTMLSANAAPPPHRDALAKAPSHMRPSRGNGAIKASGQTFYKQVCLLQSTRPRQPTAAPRPATPSPPPDPHVCHSTCTLHYHWPTPMPGRTCLLDAPRLPAPRATLSHMSPISQASKVPARRSYYYYPPILAFPMLSLTSDLVSCPAARIPPRHPLSPRMPSRLHYCELLPSCA